MQDITLSDNGAELINPGMGWKLHYYDNSITNYGDRLDPADTLDDWPGLSTIYMRLPWSAVEPRHQDFDWSVVDAPAQRFIDKGKQIALRFSASEHKLEYATPKWVFDAGAKHYRFKPGQIVENGPFVEPDFNDPIFLERLDRFLEAAAQRYDGNPEVAFIDVGSFGVWGEGHTYWSTRNHYDAATVKRHIDLHLKHFKRTPLVGTEPLSDHGRGIGAHDYAFEKGLLYRSDSILVMPGDLIYRPQYAARVWPHRPVILESQHYWESVRDNVWGDGGAHLEAVEHYHASYAAIHDYADVFLNGCRDLIRQINQRLGYRLVCSRVQWPEQVSINEPFVIRSQWHNAGVAPCYAGGLVTWTLKTKAGGIVAVLVDNTFDVRGLSNSAPGAPLKLPVQSHLRLPPVVFKPGEYELFVSVGTRTGTPRYALPLPGEDGHRRYKVGSIKVRLTAT